MFDECVRVGGERSQLSMRCRLADFTTPTLTLDMLLRAVTMITQPPDGFK